ncbi:MAG TPA: ABC transporter permease [Acidimicrobiia bacterium]|nr:ABC transporter permease [Acidimicrobiia bacterium]
MLAYIIRRLVYGLITVLALSVVVFFLIQAGGGSPLDRLRGNPRMAPMIPVLTEHFGLDKPAIQQYFTWLRNFGTPDWDKVGVDGVSPFVAIGVAIAYTIGAMVAKVRTAWWRTFRTFSIIAVWLLALWFAKGRISFALDWSQSFRGDGSVWNLVFGAAGATFRLGLAALVLALLIGIPLGIYQAIRQYSFFDQLGTTFSFVAFSTPIFIIGVGLQLVFAYYLERWTGVKLFFVAGMTSTGYSQLSFWGQMGDIVRHLALPALAIALISTATYSRFQRASMLEVMHSDYLRTAKAKGLPRRRVIVKHALRNALIPIVTLVSLDIAAIIGGAIITESIFGWPGIGRLYINAINAVDYPVVMAVVMAIGIGIVIMNIVADILYGVLDPRVRYD